MVLTEKVGKLFTTNMQLYIKNEEWGGAVLHGSV